MINRHLHQNQLKNLFGFLFRNRIINIMRLIPKCGRSSVPWIYFSVGSSLRATFVSFRELQQAYFRWLQQVDIFACSMAEKTAIGRANLEIFSIGDVVSHNANPDKLGYIEAKEYQGKVPTILVDWGNGTPMPECPWLLEAF